MTAEVVRMHGIRKAYRRGAASVDALRGIDLVVERGSFTAIVGASGSGKSTLMNLVGCLDTPTSGAYWLDGESVDGLSPDALADVRNRRIGFVFQGFALIPDLTASENVELPLMFGGMAKRPRRDRARELLDRVGLADRAGHRPTELSGGQMQRVAIARALAMKPALLLADEPTGNLDSVAGRQILDLFAELHRDGGTILMITHDDGLAARIPRVLEMRDGRVVSERIQVNDA